MVLGGTAWLSREVVRRALAGGNAVTCLARGTSGSPPSGATWVEADRTSPAAYEAVACTSWDLVVDVARQPGHVRGAVGALAGRAAHWVFVSSGNVYADHRTVGADESATLLPPLAGDVMTDMTVYGEAKVACERLVLDALGTDRALVARVGLIGGPGDEFDRTGYWPARFADPSGSDGSVLVPDEPDLPTSVVDVRDLAAWLLDAGARRLTGTYDVVGPSLGLAEHLDVARRVAGHTGPVRAASPAWLLEQGVEPWMGPRSLPLWLADPDWRGFNARDGARARAAGLVTRPLTETLADTLAWERTRPPDRVRRAGLTADEERALLAALEATGG
nr:NAD-dependent epimerase/dehydratase family protein [Microlunatus antarcticus]